MVIRWIGAVLILFSGAGVGFSAVRQYLQQERILEELIETVDFISSELNCRLTPLPLLCMDAAKQTSGMVAHVFRQLADELERQDALDAHSCMDSVLAKMDGLPENVRNNLDFLGRNLGRFDLEGQLAGLDAVKQMCERDLRGLQNNKESRLRSYQTLGFCAGAALVILLI